MKFARRKASCTRLDCKRNWNEMRELHEQPIMEFTENFRSDGKGPARDLIPHFPLPINKTKISGKTFETTKRETGKVDDDENKSKLGVFMTYTGAGTSQSVKLTEYELDDW